MFFTFGHLARRYKVELIVCGFFMPVELRSHYFAGCVQSIGGIFVICSIIESGAKIAVVH